MIIFWCRYFSCCKINTWHRTDDVVYVSGFRYFNCWMWQTIFVYWNADLLVVDHVNSPISHHILFANVGRFSQFILRYSIIFFLHHTQSSYLIIGGGARYSHDEGQQPPTGGSFPNGGAGAPRSPTVVPPLLIITRLVFDNSCNCHRQRTSSRLLEWSRIGVSSHDTLLGLLYTEKTT